MLLLNVIIIFLIMYIILPVIANIVIRKFLKRKYVRKGYVCLTFDDGPSSQSTLKILSLLKAYNSKATFFVLGSHIEKHPEIVNRILKDGHEIGEHGYQHLHPWKSSPWKYAIDLIKSHKTLKNLNIHDQVLHFRPPFGKINLLTLLYVVFSGKKFAYWDIDPKDYKNKSPKQIANEIFTQSPQGSIILLHDGRTNSNNSADITVETLKLILPVFDKEQLHLDSMVNAIANNQ